MCAKLSSASDTISWVSSSLSKLQRDSRFSFIDGLFDELKKALAERVLNAEIDDHLDHEAGEGSKNRRNGYSKKTVLTDVSKIDVRIPRDREGTFDPKLIQRYQR